MAFTSFGNSFVTLLCYLFWEIRFRFFYCLVSMFFFFFSIKKKYFFFTTVRRQLLIFTEMFVLV